MTASTLMLELPAELVEQIAARAAELVTERQDEPEPWIGVEQAAEHLGGTSSSRIYSLVSARRIPYSKDGSRLLFKRSALDEWVRCGGARCP
jgi:excisionase family DNA binding protein